VNDADDLTSRYRVPAWRIAAGLAVLAGLLLMGAGLLPVYFRNLQLQNYLRETHPASEAQVREVVLNEGRALGLDIAPDQLQIRRSPAGGSTNVRYAVHVSLPLYTVDLHFSSSFSPTQE
jgi:hypothetical protein